MQGLHLKAAFLNGTHAQVYSSVGFAFKGYSAVSIVCEEKYLSFIISVGRINKNDFKRTFLQMKL